MRTPGFGCFFAYLYFNASIAGLGLLMLPLALGALAQTGVDARLLGLLAFLEQGASAATAIVVSSRMSRLVPPAVCGVGSLLAAIGNLVATVFTTAPGTLVVSRICVGVGAGLMYAGGVATVARLRRPESMYGFIGMAPCVTALIGFSLAPTLVAWGHGAGGILAFQGISAALNAVTMLAGTRWLGAFVRRDKGGASVATGGLPQPPSLAFPVRAACLATILLLAIGDASVWAFIAPLGERVGIDLAGISRLLIGTAIIGSLGPLLAGVIGVRFGLLRPVLIGQAVMVATAMWLVLPGTAAAFAAALLLRVFTVLFLYPMYQGLRARLDPVGRLVAAGAGFHTVGYSIGPLLGGLLIAPDGPGPRTSVCSQPRPRSRVSS